MKNIHAFFVRFIDDEVSVEIRTTTENWPFHRAKLESFNGDKKKARQWCIDRVDEEDQRIEATKGNQ